MPEKFAFLRSDNKFNTYYQFKVALYHEMKAERRREQKAKAVANANAATAALQDHISEQKAKAVANANAATAALKQTAKKFRN